MSREREERAARPVRRIAREEERVWSQFYREVGDPTVAAELMAHMDQDEHAKSMHSGLYLRCRQSLRKAKRRQARARAMGNVVRAFGRLLIRPLSVLRQCGLFCGAVGMALLTNGAEPATGQLRKIGPRPACAAKEAVAEDGKQASGSDCH